MRKWCEHQSWRFRGNTDGGATCWLKCEVRIRTVAGLLQHVCLDFKLQAVRRAAGCTMRARGFLIWKYITFSAFCPAIAVFLHAVMILRDFRQILEYQLRLLPTHRTSYHNSEITTGQIMPSQSVTVFSNRFLVAASNGGWSLSYAFPIFPRLLLQGSSRNSS